MPVLEIPFADAFQFDPSPTVRRFPRMSLAKPAEDLEWRRVLVSGLAELPVNLG
jgi:hypothetical protein